MRIFVYFLNQLGFNLSRNALMAVAAFSTAFFSLFTLGVFLIFVTTIRNFASNLEDQIEVRAFLDKDIDPGTRATVEKTIQRYPQVRGVEYVSPARAARDFEEWLGASLGLEGETSNPLPGSFVVRVTDPRHMKNVANMIQELDGVEEILFEEPILRQIITLSVSVKFIGILTILFMGLITLFTIMNTIRLTVIARRSEIRIMQLVGATSWFIRWPFLLEGLAIGLVGAVTAILILTGAYGLAEIWLGKVKVFNFLFPMVDLGLMTRYLLAVLLAAGAVMGFLGSYLSVSKYLSEDV